ncbi:MAG: hypothetical protein IJ407_03045 [Clostridia bacterium]|nr:hypothetical protein [Clostridia bacterium]
MTEKEQAFMDYEKKQETQMKRGKTMICLIAGFEIAIAVFNLILDFNISQLLIGAIMVGLSVALLSGYTWVRYLFAVSSGLCAFAFFAMLFMVLGDFSWVGDTLSGGVRLLITSIIGLAVCLTVCLLLLFSKSVKEYMYFKRNG